MGSLREANFTKLEDVTPTDGPFLLQSRVSGKKTRGVGPDSKETRRFRKFRKLRLLSVVGLAGSEDWESWQ